MKDSLPVTKVIPKRCSALVDTVHLRISVSTQVDLKLS
jgi:hypothetical protein